MQRNGRIARLIEETPASYPLRFVVAGDSGASTADGIHFIMSRGGGSGLCSDYRGICTEGAGRPDDRGSLYHAVAIAIAENGLGTRHSGVRPSEDEQRRLRRRLLEEGLRKEVCQPL